MGACGLLQECVCECVFVCMRARTPQSRPLLLHCIETHVAGEGMARIGSVSLLSVLDFTHLGSSLSTRSFACIDPSILASDLLHLGSLPLPRSHG